VPERNLPVRRYKKTGKQRCVWYTPQPGSQAETDREVPSVDEWKSAKEIPCVNRKRLNSWTSFRVSKT